MMQDFIAAAAKPAKRRLVAGIGEIDTVDETGWASLLIRHHIDQRRRKQQRRQRQPGTHRTPHLVHQRRRMRTKVTGIKA